MHSRGLLFGYDIHALGESPRQVASRQSRVVRAGEWARDALARVVFAGKTTRQGTTDVMMSTDNQACYCTNSFQLLNWSDHRMAKPIQVKAIPNHNM